MLLFSFLIKPEALLAVPSESADFPNWVLQTDFVESNKYKK